MDLDKLKRISLDLELIDSTNVSYTTGRNRGLTDVETERKANTALLEVEDVIYELIKDLEA